MVFGVPMMAGIRVAGASAGTVAGNVIDGVGASDEGDLGRVGVLLVSCGEVQVSGNVIGRVGPDGQFAGIALGVGVAIPQDTAAVAGTSCATASAPAGGAPPVRASWRALMVSGAGSAGRQPGYHRGGTVRVPAGAGQRQGRHRVHR